MAQSAIVSTLTYNMTSRIAIKRLERKSTMPQSSKCRQQQLPPSILSSAGIADAPLSAALPLHRAAAASVASSALSLHPILVATHTHRRQQTLMCIALQLLWFTLFNFKLPGSCPDNSSNSPILPHNKQCAKGHPRQRYSGVAVRLMCAAVLACIVAAIPLAAATSATVNPVTGDDSQCREDTPISCRTIARALQFRGVSFLSLSAGVYNEATIGISSIYSLVISGVPNSTVFDCSRRQGATIGAAFIITNSTVVITGVTFQNCFNPTANGGAVSASDSSIVVSHCSFTACSAASGGAVSVTGLSSGLFLVIQNCTFTRNLATGGDSGCPEDLSQPCSTWGGAIAAFEIFNVSVSGCTMTDNNARAFLPPSSSLMARASSNSVAGGGCLSVLFRGNASRSAVHISGNSFVGCAVDVPGTDLIAVGNGECVYAADVLLFVTAAQGTAEQCRSTLASRPD
jgi:hypothetical protein